MLKPEFAKCEEQRILFLYLFYFVRTNKTNTKIKHHGPKSSTVYISSDRRYFQYVFFQLRIVVYDRANPAEKATAAITIEVNRNENSPSFTESTYRVDAVETMDLGSFIADVNATDSDGVRLV